MVSAGFDAHFLDPIAMMNVTVSGFGKLTQLIKELAEEQCQGRIVYTLEGGYNLEALAHSILACFKALLGEPLSDDPLGSPQRRPSPDITFAIQTIRQTMGF
jgi:acetoin utilization deacetylase AcuC-like enzyme